VRDAAFGQYYPQKSFIHALDARAKFLFMIAYIVFIFFIRTFAGFAFAALCLCVPVALSRVPPRLILRSLRTILFLIVFTMILNVFFYAPPAGDAPLAAWWIFRVYSGGLMYAGRMAARLILLVLGPSLLTLTTTPVQLTGAIESLLRPLKWIKFPVHELAMIMSIALSIVPTIMEETDKIIKAQKARCADFESGNLLKRAKSLVPILVPLFVSSFRRADELALAMDSRCYKGGKGRTRMKIPRLSWRDAAAAAGMALFGGAVLLLRYNWFGWAFLNTLV
jgi:energy-coupling factor transport system permease protein